MDSHYSSVNPKTKVPISTYSVDLYSPHVYPYFPYDIGWENVPKHQDMFSLMIIPFILLCMFDSDILRRNYNYYVVTVVDG